jgi:predicted MFS family arabinose efflux permease
MSDIYVVGRAVDARNSGEKSFPFLSLLALAAVGFITILTEVLPAGLLTQNADDLSVSEAYVGQMVSVYALGSLIAAIPLTKMTQSIRRRPLLISAVFGFLIANLLTAVSSYYWLMMIGRFIAGVSAGLSWALLAGYAARMVPEEQKGRAITIAMVGTPIALSIGVPATTFLGTLIGWRLCFALLSLLAILLIVWIATKVPDFPGQEASRQQSLRSVITMPGIRSILFVTLTFVLAHNILYTYVVPLLANAGLEERTDVMLMLFGMASLVSIWITGVYIDGKLRQLSLLSSLLFICVAVAIGVFPQQALVICAVVVVWGFAFGGVATLFQTALARTAGDATDVAQSMLVTIWNTAIAGGGVLGGLLLEEIGINAFSPALLGLLIPAFVATWIAQRHGFCNH